MQNSTAALTSPSVNRGLSERQSAPESVAQPHEAFLQPYGLAAQSSEQDAEDQNDGRGGLERHLHADDHRAQSQPLKDDGAHAFGQTRAERQPEQSSGNDGRRVDQRPEGKNHDSLLVSRSGSGFKLNLLYRKISPHAPENFGGGVENLLLTPPRALRIT